MTTHYTVLGSRGFIGSRLLAALQSTGLSCLTPERGESLLDQPLGDVFYCIGLTNDYNNNPSATIEAHAGFLSHILQQCTFDRLIYLSSARLYDGQSGVCSEDRDLIFNPVNSRHLYDLSKALGENLCLTLAPERTCIARLSSVYDKNPDAPGFLSHLLQRLTKERHFTVDSTSGIVRDYIHVDDVVKGLTAICSRKKNGIINLACGENISNQDIVDILNAHGRTVALSGSSDRENQPFCDITKIKALGLAPLNVPAYLEKFIRDLNHHAID